MTEDYFKKEFAYMFQVDKREPISLFGFETSDGWNNLLYNLLCIVAMIDKDKHIRVVQVKSKFAGLCFYFEWVGPPRKKTLHDYYVDIVNRMPLPVRRFLKFPSRKMDETYQQIYDIVNLFERISYRVCEECGEPASSKSNGHWVYTMCDDCWNEIQLIKAAKETMINEKLLCSGHLQPEDI